MPKLETTLDLTDARFQELFTRLNPEQQTAVNTTEGPVLVIAGPGTGKTQILAMRIANILRNPDLQMNPSNILCLTFTESGAAAMRERLIDIIGTAAYQVRVHTFHSFCNEVIQSHPEIFTRLNSISDLEQAELINQLIDELDAGSALKPFGDAYLYRDEIKYSLQNFKKEYISPEGLIAAVTELDEFITHAREVLEQITNIDLRSKPKPELSDMAIHLERLSVISPDSSYRKYIDNLYAQVQNLREFRDQVKKFVEDAGKNSPRLLALAQIYQRYNAELSSRRLYDYEDMILRVITELQARPELLAEYQEQYQYILADEYQDTNGSQNQILRLLVSYYQENPNLFVVGDDDQSIYRFQGASVENIFDFRTSYQNHLTEIVLKNNYRSQQQILDAALSSIRHNENRLAKDKQLISCSDAALKPVTITAYNSVFTEAYSIAKRIQELIANGINPSEIAVLYREHKHSNLIATALYKLDVPYLIKGQENIFENLEILQLVDLIKVIQKPKSSNLIFNLLNYNFLRASDLLAGITQHDVFSAVSNYRQQGPSFIEYLLDNPKFKAFAEAILRANNEAANLNFELFFEKVIRDFNYLGYALEAADRLSRVNNLACLFNEIKKLVANGSPLRNSKLRHQINNDTGARFDLEDFIYYIDTAIATKVKIDAKSIASSKNAVQLMSAHAAKGLEFDYVFIYNCVDKSWGNKSGRSIIKLPPAIAGKAKLKIDSDEEERRLFYVALTRARLEANISYHLKNDKGSGVQPSMFITELDKQYCQILEPEIQSETELEMLATQFAYVDNTDNILSLEHDFIEGLLTGYKLSVTHLNNYLRCPRLFFYQNLLRVPAAKTKHACFGSAVHNALFDLGTAIKSGNKDAGLEFLLKRFEERLKDENMSSQDYTDALVFGKDTLTKYFNQYRTKLYDPSVTLLLEHNFGHKGLSYKDIELDGKLDKIEIVDGRAVVVDYKTGNPSTKAKALNPGGDYHRQIVFYKLLIDLARKAGLFKAEMLRGEIDFVQADAKGNFFKESIYVSDEDLSTLEKNIDDICAGLKAQQFDKTTDRKVCERCDFNAICWR